MDTRKIIEKANKLRQQEQEETQEAASRQHQLLKKAERKAQEQVHVNPNSYKLFRVMLTAHWSWLFIIGIAALVYGYVFLHVVMYDNAPINWMIVWIGTGIIGVTELILLWRYFRFRTWHQQLPFVLEGWERWAKNPLFLQKSSWFPCKLRLEMMTQPSPDVLEALLFLIKQKCNAQRYMPDDGTPIPTWEQVPLGVQGLANYDVARILYQFITREMTKLHQEGALSIRKVVIEIDGDVQNYLLPSSD